jgi:hypothetical protein
VVRAALDALGAGDDRRARRQFRGNHARSLAHVLRGYREQDGLVSSDLGPQRGDADALVQPHSRQARRLASIQQEIGAGQVARGEHHCTAGARDHVGERRAPRACSDDGDVIECHSRSV